jgi:hypothetical protein
MAYRQYTSCTSRKNYIGKWAAQVIVAAAVAALPLIAGATLLPAVGLIVFAAIIAYCRWWLNDRLICLGGDVCALGWVVTVEPPSEKSGLDIFDTDFSFSMALAPDRLGVTQAEAELGPQGHLVKPQPETAGLDFKGNLVKQYANYDETATLHCEFEGGGVYDLLLAALIAFALCVAATIAYLIPVVGWIIGLILSILAWLFGAGGAIVAANDQGNPNDVDANLGEIHENDPTRMGADIVVVQGTWVYDSAHEGWNEIHPIKHCQRVGTWGGNWSGLDPSPARWCEAIGHVRDPLTIDAQRDPENTWAIHPVIDGCGRAAEPERPPLIK